MLQAFIGGLGRMAVHPKIRYIAACVESSMDKDRIPFILSAFIVMISLSIGVWKGEGMTVGVCLAALAVSIPAAAYCPPATSKYSVIAAVAALACAVCMITVVPENALVMGGDTELIWVYAAGIITGAALIPQALLFFFAVAAKFKASYNWVMVFGLGWLVALGMTIPKTLMILVFWYGEVQAGLLSNPATVIGLMVNLILFLIFFSAAGGVLRKNRYIITRNGTEAMR